MAATNAEIEKMSFREKQKYFEKEMQGNPDNPASKPPAKQFSYLSEHELAIMRQEEAKKVGGMSQAEILSYVAGGAGDVTPDQDLDQLLSSLDSKRMKSLEADAVQAQAVIAKAQEMSRDDDEPSHPNHNGDSRVEVTRKQVYGMKLGESQH